MSDSDSDTDAVGSLFEMLLDEDPLTRRLSIPSWLRALLLKDLLKVHPAVAEDVAERLIDGFMGPDVTGVADLLSWLVAYRSRALIRASLAGLIACSPFEAIPVVGEIKRADAERPLISQLLEPYRRTARSWLEAYAAVRPDAEVERRRPRPDEWPSPLPWSGLEALTSHAVRIRGLAAADSSMRQSGRVPLKVKRPDLSQRPGSQGSIVAGEEIWNSSALEVFHEDGANRALLPLSITALAAPGSDPRELTGSTRGLVSAVIEGRGRSMIVEQMTLDIGDQFVSREASIGVTRTVESDGLLFAHLGSLPSSIGRNLPATFRAVEGERLVAGVGPVISRYCDETSGLLRLAAEMSDAGDVPTASDWCRLSRSVREPWRFVSTGRAFVSLSEVRVAWRERARLTHRSRDLWPFNGSGGYYLQVEGFWHGEDDMYSVSVRALDGYRVEALEIESTPRRAGGAATDAHTAVGIHLSWSAGAYAMTVMVTLVTSLLLLIVSLSAADGSLVGGGALGNLLPWVISVLSPLVGVVFTQRRSEGEAAASPLSRYRMVVTRGVALAVIATVLVVATSSTEPYGEGQLVLAIIDGCMVAYLLAVTLLSTVRRSWYARSLGRHLERGLDAARR
jgi:hypothetical protein